MARKTVAALAVLLLAVAVAMQAEAKEVTCADVEKSLVQCVPYLMEGARSPSEACCEGVKNLKKITPTRADRQKACQCLKDAAARVPVRPDSAAELPRKCGVEPEIPISPQIDCKSLVVSYVEFLRLEMEKQRLEMN